MSERPPGASHSLAALRQPNLRLFVAGAFSSGVASSMLTSAVLWQVYEVSGSAFMLGMLGLVRLVPSVAMALVGGAIADSYDRRRVALAASVVPMAGAVTLFLASRADLVNLPLIYVIIFLVALSAVVQGPARQALLPAVISKELLPKAVTINSTAGSLARISGPAGAGLLIGWSGATAAYAASGILIGVSMLVLVLLRVNTAPVGPRRTVSLAVIREGLSFVWRRQVLIGVMALDLICVVFGNAAALLPIFATDILDVGPRGFGLLSASIEAGAVSMAVLLLFLPQVDRAGRALFLSVAAFGIATVIFGLSRSFQLSLLAYAVVGMADQLSVVMRLTTIQMATPPELLGRVNSVNTLFALSANELGAVRSGLAAGAFGAPFAAVSGGLACLTALVSMAVMLPALRDYRVEAVRSAPR